MTQQWDFSDLNKLNVDLGEQPRQTISNVRKAVEVSARLTKDEWRANAQTHSGSRLRGYPYAINYDLILNVDGQISAEIGPDITKNQGNFGMVEDARGGVQSQPQHVRDKIRSKILDDFAEGISKAVPDL